MIFQWKKSAWSTAVAQEWKKGGKRERVDYQGRWLWCTAAKDQKKEAERRDKSKVDASWRNLLHSSDDQGNWGTIQINCYFRPYPRRPDNSVAVSFIIIRAHRHRHDGVLRPPAWTWYQRPPGPLGWSLPHRRPGKFCIPLPDDLVFLLSRGAFKSH